MTQYLECSSAEMEGLEPSNSWFKAKRLYQFVYISMLDWQDSNLPSGSGASLIPAEIPAHHVLDFAAELPLFEQARLMAGVNNLTGETYWSRVRIDGNNGIEPAPPRHWYLGFRWDF